MGLWGAPSGKPGKVRQAAEPSRRRSPGQVRAVVEPAVAGLIGSVVAILRAEGRTPLPVTDPSGRPWASAYALGSISVLTGPGTGPRATAELVLDGSGRMVLNHPVTVTGPRARPVPISCPSLAEAYEEFIAQVRISETPADGPIFMTPGGLLMMAGTPSGTIPLAEHIDRLIHLPAPLPREAPGRPG